MEEISFKRAFATFKNRFATIVTITLLVFGAGCGYTFLIKKPMYQSTASVILIDNSTKTIDDLSLGKGLAVSYAEILKSQALASMVIADLGLEMSAVELLDEIEIASSVNTGLVSVTVTDRDAEQAARIANKMMDVFKEQIEKTYDYTAMTTVSMAEVAPQPYNMSYAKDLIIYFVAGLILSVGIVFLVYYS